MDNSFNVLWQRIAEGRVKLVLEDVIFFIVVMLGGKIGILAKEGPSKEEEVKIWEEIMSTALEQREELKCSTVELSGK